MTKPYTILRNIFAAITSLAVTLVVVNAVYAWFEPLNQELRYSGTRHRFMGYDPKLGWANRPNTVGHFTDSGIDVLVHINSQGMRYHELGPKTRYRVAVLGDSLVQGAVVQEGLRFTDLLENDLNVDVLNYGVIGYGPVQTLLDLDRVIQSQPDLVIYTFTLYNDFMDNVHNQSGDLFRPYAELDGDDHIRIMGEPVPDYTDSTFYRDPWPARYPLFRLFYFTIHDRFPELSTFLFGKFKVGGPPMGNFAFSMEMLRYHEENATVTEVLKINKLLLQAIRDKLAAAHIPLVLFAAPSQPDFASIPPMPDEAAPLRYLRQQALELNVPMVTIPGFKPSPENTLPDDIHWRPLTHRMAADNLAPVILEYEKNALQKQQGAESQ